MKLLLDLAVLIVLFWFFSRAVKLLFPKSNLEQKVSEASKAGLAAYRKRYFIVFAILALLISFFSYWVLYFLAEEVFVSPEFNGLYYGVKPQAYIQSAVLFALLSAAFISPYINDRLQRDGLGFYLEELQEHVQGYRIKGLKLVQLSAGFVLLFLLLYAQMETFFVMNPKEGRAVHGFSSNNYFKISEIKEINSDKDLEIILFNGDTISLSPYNYDSKEVYDFINKNTP